MPRKRKVAPKKQARKEVDDGPDVSGFTRGERLDKLELLLKDIDRGHETKESELIMWYQNQMSRVEMLLTIHVKQMSSKVRETPILKYFELEDSKVTNGVTSDSGEGSSPAKVNVATLLSNIRDGQKNPKPSSNLPHTASSSQTGSKENRMPPPPRPKKTSTKNTVDDPTFKHFLDMVMNGESEQSMSQDLDQATYNQVVTFLKDRISFADNWRMFSEAKVRIRGRAGAARK